METIELRKAVETLLFIADSPVPLARLCQIVGEADADKVSGVIAEIKREYDEAARGIQVVEIAEGFQMATRPEGAPFVRKLYSEKMTMRLSTAALETLSIVAYRQPITRAEIEEVRGVEVIAALESLLDKRLVKVVGRKETVGRPLLYGTTAEFLRHFGLRSIEDLPPLDTFKPAEAAAAAESAENVLGAQGAAALAEPSPLAADPLADDAALAPGTIIGEPGASEAPTGERSTGEAVSESLETVAFHGMTDAPSETAAEASSETNTQPSNETTVEAAPEAPAETTAEPVVDATEASSETGEAETDDGSKETN